MERMTLGNPDKGQETSFYDPIFPYGISGILRARWVKPAGRRPNR
jgi:hypothetical protein